MTRPMGFLARSARKSKGRDEQQKSKVGGAKGGFQRKLPLAIYACMYNKGGGGGL